MGWVRVGSPLVLQSKLLCLSLFYLLTTLPLSVYVSFSQPGCLFWPPPQRLPAPRLFAYPPSYGEHKHALPTPHAACSSPALFSEYKTVLKEIEEICHNFSVSASASPVLRYQNGKKDTFAGNFSTQERKSFFNHSDNAAEVPCGFFREFPIKEVDRSAMEKCTGVVVVSAILNDHDKIRQPRGLGSDTLTSVCFFMLIDDPTHHTLRTHNITVDNDGEQLSTMGAWRVVRLAGGELPYANPAMNGVVAKHLVHRLFPNARFSVWVDAKMQLTVDPLLLVHSLLVAQGADMAVSRHPFNVHAMEEAMATARWRKWADVEAIRVQMETYCDNGLQPWSPAKLPYPSDVPDTALIVRRHGLASDLFSCLLFNELEAFNPRDQLAFAYVRDLMTPKPRIHMFDAQVLDHVAVEYRHNLKHRPPTAAAAAVTRMASSRDIAGSSCEGYLLKMWGE